MQKLHYVTLHFIVNYRRENQEDGNCGNINMKFHYAFFLGTFSKLAFISHNLRELLTLIKNY